MLESEFFVEIEIYIIPNCPPSLYFPKYSPVAGH